MSCFNCFEEDDFNKTADGGGLHTVKSSAGKLAQFILSVI